MMPFHISKLSPRMGLVISVATLVIAVAVFVYTTAIQGQTDSGDRAALEALYHATNGDNWNTSTNWLNDSVPLSE